MNVDIFKPVLNSSQTHGKLNTYTYTKAMAENVLWEEAGKLPICIVRPSISELVEIGNTELHQNSFKTLFLGLTFNSNRGMERTIPRMGIRHEWAHWTNSCLG